MLKIYFLKSEVLVIGREDYKDHPGGLSASFKKTTAEFGQEKTKPQFSITYGFVGGYCFYIKFLGHLSSQ
jgi:hypothetical protein